MSLLEASGLNFSFVGRKPLFQDACFSLQAGETVGLWAPNGAGKTTFLRILTGLEKPQSGQIRFRGKVISTKDDWSKLRLSVGFVLQNPDNQLFFPEVFDDVAFGPLNQGLTEHQARQVATETLQHLGIEHLGRELSFRLSGGQKKMVALASVLSMHPDLLLLDEPTAALDAQSRDCLAALLKQMDVAKVIVSHDIGLITDVCDRFVSIEAGKLIELEELGHESQ